MANGAECTEPTWRKAILTFIGSFFSILDRYLVEVDERAVSMLEQLTVQMARQEGVTERIHFVCSGLLALDPKSDKTDLLAIEYTCVDQ